MRLLGRMVLIVFLMVCAQAYRQPLDTSISHLQFHVSYHYSYLIYLLYQPIFQPSVNQPIIQQQILQIQSVCLQIKHLGGNDEKNSLRDICSALIQLSPQSPQILQAMLRFEDSSSVASAISLWGEVFNIVMTIRAFPNIFGGQLCQIQYSLEEIKKIMNSTSIYKSKFITNYVNDIQSVINHLVQKWNDDIVQSIVGVKELVSKVEGIISLVSTNHQIFDDFSQLSLLEIIKKSSQSLKQHNMQVMHMKWNIKTQQSNKFIKEDLTNIQKYLEVRGEYLKRVSTINRLGISNIINNISLILQ